MADDRFYVKSLRMQNFRCFEDVELGPFDPHFNLIVGENGAGKSSVLVAIAGLFGVKVPSSLGIYSKPFFGNEDVRVSYKETVFGLEGPKRIYPSRVTGESIFESNSEQTGVNLESLVSNVRINAPPSRYEFSDSDVIPLSAYYGIERRFAEGLGRGDVVLNISPRRLLGLTNWTSPSEVAVALREWLKDETIVALQGNLRANDAKVALGAVRAQRYLDLLNDALSKMMQEFKEIEYDGQRKDIILVAASGERVDFAAMSDGQRALVGLLSDIVRRVCLLNGDSLGAQTLEETPGLVLIDEIDLHLHPKWQRQIVPALKTIFPKIQFFATTHSPQVIGECKPEEIVLLTPQGQKRPSGGYGRDSNWILECVMGAEGRDPGVAERLKTMFNLIEDEKFEEAREAIKALRRDIGYGPDIVGAEAYLWRMEHLGDEAAE